jgi:hypothetical protein
MQSVISITGGPQNTVGTRQPRPRETIRRSLRLTDSQEKCRAIGKRAISRESAVAQGC